MRTALSNNEEERSFHLHMSQTYKTVGLSADGIHKLKMTDNQIPRLAKLETSTEICRWQ
jgi:hypothetical protein